jgi:hypothetical protein
LEKARGVRVTLSIPSVIWIQDLADQSPCQLTPMNRPLELAHCILKRNDFGTAFAYVLCFVVCFARHLLDYGLHLPKQLLNIVQLPRQVKCVSMTEFA